VIGVVLAGVSLGNFIGGRIADAYPGRSTLSLMYLLASLSCALVLVLTSHLENLAAPEGLFFPLRVIWLTGCVFFLPSLILGTPTPLLARLSLGSIEKTGRVVGRIQAWSTAGSIIGTFLTGFFLVSVFGTRAIILGLAALLLILAVASNPVWSRKEVLGCAASAVLLLSVGSTATSPCLKESGYYCIRIERGGSTAFLYLDKTIHGIVDTSRPSRPIGFAHTWAAVIKNRFPAGSHVDSFVAGGGSYTMPRFLKSRYDGAVTVAEIDPAVTEVTEENIGPVRAVGIKVVEMDARVALSALPDDQRFDLIIGDAFSDLTVPFHLSTREFDELVESHLNEAGIYTANIIDHEKLLFLRSFLNTLRQVFPYVSVAPAFDGPLSHGGNFFVTGSSAPVPATARTITNEELESLLTSDALTLTDDHAPVDQLLVDGRRKELIESL
jgi:hypothetical protein